MQDFPYLFPQEGGCGGFPPLRNANTAFIALCFFNGGNAKESILAVMDETTLIQEGKLEPRNGVYITAAYYAQTGNAAVNKISAASKFLKTLNIGERMKTLEFAKGENPLPVELLNSSVIVSQKTNYLVAQ